NALGLPQSLLIPPIVVIVIPTREMSAFGGKADIGLRSQRGFLPARGWGAKQSIDPHISDAPHKQIRKRQRATAASRPRACLGGGVKRKGEYVMIKNYFR